MLKSSCTPAEICGRLRAELVIVKNPAVCFANPQIFLYAAGTTQKQPPTYFRSVPELFQVLHIIYNPKIKYSFIYTFYNSSLTPATEYVIASEAWQSMLKEAV